MRLTVTTCCAAFFVLFSCKKTEVYVPVATTTNSQAQLQPAVTHTENFESGSKTTYPKAKIALSTGTWTFTAALLGNTSSDIKNGNQSARIKASGSLTANFNFTNGASTVTIQHAAYATSGTSTWQLWYSTNNGTSYVQAGSTITTSAHTLQTATFTINVAGNIRFQVRKTDGTKNLLNIDDFAVTDYVGSTAKKVLFDATKAELAGNADWVIDEDSNVPKSLPTPDQSTVTASTAETYWTGALSSWGIALVKQGVHVETLPTTGSITYGNSSNAQDLANYDVFIVDEPNIVFSSAEKTAILQFVQNGGGLFMISDHTLSDRNNDGWDSPAIWNDLMTNNTVQQNPFGFSVDLTNISELTSNVLAGSGNTILHGSQGNVTQLQYNNGATLTLNSSANSSVEGLIWQSGYAQSNTHVMCASSAFGTGRVFVITDSSPMDDGTGASGNSLYVDWPLYSHSQLCMNATLWLAKLQ